MKRALPHSHKRGSAIRMNKLFGAVAVPIFAAVLLLAGATVLAQSTDAAPDPLARNKKNVLAFYDLATNQAKPREAVERFVGDSYTQHNPEVADGKEAFVAYFEKQAKTYPGKKFEFKRVIAEGNL